MKIRLSLLEVFFLELIIWLAIWLLNDYLAALLTIILTAIVFAVLLLALIAEWIERSKVPRMYFWIMGITVLTPVLAALVYWLVLGGQLSFLQ